MGPYTGRVNLCLSASKTVAISPLPPPEWYNKVQESKVYLPKQHSESHKSMDESEGLMWIISLPTAHPGGRCQALCPLAC